MRRTATGLTVAAIAGVSLALGLAGEAADSSVVPTGIYTSMREGARSGDLVGVELFVLRGSTGLYGVLQGSEGAPGNPFAVPLQSTGNTVRFSVPDDCACGLAPGEYVAQLSRSGALRGPGSFGERRLPRAASYWQGP